MSKRKKDDEFEEEYENNQKKGSFFRKLFFTIILIIFLIVIYSRYIGTSGLILKEYSVKSNIKIQNFSELKIAHFSDFHYGTTTGLEELENLRKKINITKPDIIVFTGDFIDKNKKITDSEVKDLSLELKKMESTYGKYFITGNHDKKCKSYNKIFEDADFINLDNGYDVIYNKKNESILLTGLAYKDNGMWINSVIGNYQDSYKILLMHLPDTFDDIKNYNFDLVLAGHSHNGQIRVPFYGAITTPNNAKKYYKSHYKYNSTDFYISSGIGTSVINYRLFNKPSFNLYRLEK